MYISGLLGVKKRPRADETISRTRSTITLTTIRYPSDDDKRRLGG